MVEANSGEPPKDIAATAKGEARQTDMAELGATVDAAVKELEEAAAAEDGYAREARLPWRRGITFEDTLRAVRLHETMEAQYAALKNQVSKYESERAQYDSAKRGELLNSLEGFYKKYLQIIIDETGLHADKFTGGHPSWLEEKVAADCAETQIRKEIAAPRSYPFAAPLPYRPNSPAGALNACLDHHYKNAMRRCYQILQDFEKEFCTGFDGVLQDLKTELLRTTTKG